MLSHAAILGIRAYQLWLSPRKGYGCAYRLAHGGPGCSGYAKAVIAERGFLSALPAIRLRLRDCHEAVLLLRSERPEEGRRRRDRWCDNCCIPDVSGCCGLFGRRGGGPDPTPGDCTPNGCDCVPGDCGSP